MKRNRKLMIFALYALVSFGITCLVAIILEWRKNGMRKKWTRNVAILIALMIVLSGCGVTKTAESVKKSEKSREIGLSEKLDTVFTNSPSGFNGSVLIAVNGKVVLEKGYGMADVLRKRLNTKETVFNIFSVTKQFTAMAIMMLEERGKLSVEDPVSKYIPDFKNGDKIRIHNLLTHTSGIGDCSNRINRTIDEYSTVNQLISEIKKLPATSKVGEKWDYSNSNYIILGFIIEKVSGQKYGDFLKTNIFDPLKMENTRYYFKENYLKDKAFGYINIGAPKTIRGKKFNQSYSYAAGGLNSSVEDLYKWDQALYTEKLVKKATLKRIFTPEKENYAYGWIIDEVYSNCNEHSGGFFGTGFLSEIYRFTDSKTTVIYLMNEEDDSALLAVEKGILKVLEDEKIIRKK